MDKDFETIIDYVSYPIILSYVVDNEGILIARFNFHPQMDCDHFIEQVTPEQIERLIKSAGNKFKKGFGGRPSSMVSPMTKERLSIVHTKRNPQNDHKCLRCSISFKGFKWRNYCDACVKLNNDDRRKNAATAGYYSNYHKERSKDPEYVKARTQKHKEWVEKNREKLNAYIRKYNRTKNCTCCDVAITKKSKTNMCIHCFNKRKRA